MLVLTALLIASFLAIFVVFPLLASDKGEKSALPIDVTPAEDLKRRRLVLYENLEDLEFEYQARKIAREDYEALKRSYKSDAALLMAASQQLEGERAEDRWIEREVAARRERRGTKTTEAYLCRKCGFENPLPVKYCGECGAPIAKTKN